MKIIDKTNDTWEIGDTVIDNDGRKGTIKKDKDDDFVIIRIDDNHIGNWCNGLAYEFGSSMQRLQHNASEFHKVNDNNDNEDWQPGDFVKNLDGEIGLITYDNDGDICILATKGSYAFNEAVPLIATENTSLSEFQRSFTGKWHKVPSTLILGE